jgi:hypothetical protein
MMAATTVVGMLSCWPLQVQALDGTMRAGGGEEEDTVMAADGYRQQSTKSGDDNGRCHGDSDDNGNSNGNGNCNDNGTMATATTISNKRQQKKPRRLR